MYVHKLQGFLGGEGKEQRRVQSNFEQDTSLYPEVTTLSHLRNFVF